VGELNRSTLGIASEVEPLKRSRYSNHRVEQRESTAQSFQHLQASSRSVQTSIRDRFLLSLGKSLLLRQLGVPNAERENNQWNRQTNSSDAKQALRLLVGENHIISIRRPHRVRICEEQRLCIDFRCEGGISKPATELYGENLIPDGARNGIAQGAADVVGCKVNSGDDGEV
jgi:hypothetical protein